jgi:hypothetical protein
MAVGACADFEALRIKISSKTLRYVIYFYYYGNKNCCVLRG